MDMANLLNLNVDALFEQHSVPEIDIVHKKIQAVVENKREELRTMVGERYRDLLQAADTITAMQDSSGTLIEQVDRITANCKTLHDQQLIGFKTSGDSGDVLRSRNANKQLGNYFSTMVQIKLLTSLPELIWSHIDGERFFAAAELFIFSRHISTGLQLDANNTLMRKLPVAKNQWEILKSFHVTIKQRLLVVLEREELQTNSAVDCLMSLFLLERSSLNEVLKTFLRLRCAAFFCCLSDGSDVTRQRRVKDRILSSLKVLNGTIDLIEKCFLEKSILLQRLAEHSNPNAAPTVARMDSHDAQFAHLLPDIIRNFRPAFEAQSLDVTQVRLSLEQWLEDTKRIAGVQLKQLFGRVPSMHVMQEIKAEAIAYRKELNYAPIAEKFELTQSLDFYELKYMPLINQRVRDIIHDSWQRAVQTTFEMFERALQSAASRNQNLWVENATDLPLSLEQALSDDRKTKQLLMRIKGYDSEVIAFCTHFDRQLADIVAEMSSLLEEQSARAEDKLGLIEFLRDTAQSQLTDLMGRVKALRLSGEQRHELLFVVRAFVALVELCPHLKICFCQRTSWRQWVGNALAGSVEVWNRICLLLGEETFNYWRLIVDSLLAEHQCQQLMPAELTYDVILVDFANWETVEVDQKDEQDKMIVSSFRIPSQPRLSLQSYFFELERSLNATVPQTLPPKVLHYFNQTLLAQLLAHYQQLAAQPATSRSQNVALQLYFDVKFLQGVFAISRDERGLCEEFHALQSTLKDSIDPFDFELFSEHIATNVKRSTVRLSSLTGCLTPLSSYELAANSAFEQEKEPNVLTLSSCGSTTLWFPLLPIITPNAGAAGAPSTRDPNEKRPTTSNSSATTTTTTTSKATTTTPTRKPQATRRSDASGSGTATTTTKPKSSAASFFGAMSQEWFR